MLNFRRVAWMLLAAAATASVAKDFPSPHKTIAEPLVVSDRYEELNARWEKLSAEANSYAVCKSRAWLDVAFDSRAQRDASGIVTTALNNAQTLLEGVDPAALAKSAAPDQQPTRTIRPDLWDTVSRAKRHANAKCAACQLAELEVQLDQAQHAYNALGWRHARPYVQHAERIADSMRQKLNTCPAETGIPDPVSNPVGAPVAAPADITPDARVWDRVHFATDSSAITAAASNTLGEIARAMRAQSSIVILLEGHADIRGDEKYNVDLSVRRAEAVRSALVRLGVDAKRVSVVGLGETKPSTSGTGATAFAANRRVELIYSLDAQFPATRQETHIQPDYRK